MADATDDRRIGTVIAGYRIDSRLGRGGMGVVYRAHHLQLEREAALKLIAPELAETSGFRERFAREARLAAALAHPNIVTVYDAGEVDGTLYLAMQYVEGSDLAAILAEQGRLRPYRAVDVCRQVAGALDAAHEKGLIHRDVKPANVLISGRDAYLTDFGLTKRVEGEAAPITNVGDVVGTIHYVAPEQIEGAGVSARSDIYSLGCLLFHCLTGEVPFSRENDVAVIYAHLSEAPPRPSTLRADLPAGLDDVIAKALDKVPERRFASCSELMAAARVAVDAAGPLSETSPSLVTRLDEVRDVAAAARRARVLLAGIDASTRAIARVALSARVEVRETASARGAVDAARDTRPDLVILNSAEAVGALRADPLTRDSNLLLLVEEGETVDAPADERLSAPFSPLQLQVKLRKLLGADAVGA
jgi:serine/threonine protein kinase